jgi:hypothetical protein
LGALRASLDALQRAVILTGDPTAHANMRKTIDLNRVGA